MQDPNHTPPPDEHRSESPAVLAEVLIGRIIDGEAGADDRRRFEQLADSDAALWRTLAVRQQDMAALTARIERELSKIDRIDLPIGAGTGEQHEADQDDRYSLRRRLPWVIAIAGWAAVIAVSTAWIVLDMRVERVWRLGDGVQPVGVDTTFGQQWTPEEHLREYLRADYVLGELPPTLLEVQELEDGRKAVRMLRRIEEVAIIEPKADVPVDDEGELTVPPEELREGAGDGPSAEDQ